VKYNSIKKRILIYRGLAHGMSVLFHPLLLPTFIFLLVANFSPLAITPLNSEQGKDYLVWMIFLSTFCLPFLMLVLYILIQQTKWDIKSFVMEENKERVFPFLIIAIFYSAVVYFLKKAPMINDTIVIIIASITVVILLIALISSFWKISAHAVGITGLISILTAINNTTPDSVLFYPILILIPLGGLLMSARLYLNAHTPLQILAGCILGIITGVIDNFLI
jgi:membrane-associated phospholipid phosphatase